MTCATCHAEVINTESLGFCCGRGSNSQPQVLEMPTVPDDLMELYIESLELQLHSRKYNNAFSMSAIGTTGSFEIFKAPCNSILTGKTYHRMLPGNDKSGPLRWFLNDSDYSSLQIEQFSLDSELIDSLKTTLLRCNPLFQQFKLLADEPSEEARLEITISDNREIAAIIIPNRNGEMKNRAIVCWKTTEQQATFIEVTSPLFLPLHYVMICPQGTPGWSLYLQIGGRKISMLMFYRQMVLRCSTLHLFGSFFNEFCVDIFSAIEENRLNWIKFNQSKILRKEDLNDPHELGRVFLPASFIGSYRHNQKMVADALAIVSRLKNPTYFITFTCNPNWSEIQERLRPRQNYSDRPDVVNMVFKAKLQKF